MDMPPPQRHTEMNALNVQEPLLVAVTSKMLIWEWVLLRAYLLVQERELMVQQVYKHD